MAASSSWKATLAERAAKIPTTSWFRAVGPKIFPPLDRLVSKLSGGKATFGAKIIVNSTGAKSGQPRQTPLEAIPQDGGAFLIVGSNFAQDHHPAWTFNLMANPECSVLRKGVTTPCRAVHLTGADREQAWGEALDHWPNWAEYTNVTDREFRLFRLEPTP